MMTMELDQTEQEMIAYLSKPIDQWSHQWGRLNDIARDELDWQFAEEGSSEKGGAKKWPPLKPKYAEIKPSIPGVLFGGQRLMILKGAYWRSARGKWTRIRFRRDTLIVHFARGVRSKDGFDYPSYWNKQKGPISPVHAGARPMAATPRFVKSITEYFIDHLKIMFGD